MMPSEPDKKMDELLRTYARKRREDAGEPLEMHPATRRLLQAEAARLRPREATPQRTLWSWLALRWPRVGFAVGVFALLAVAVWNWMPDRSRSSSPSLLAKQEKVAPDAPAPGRDANAASVEQLGARSELDKDLADGLKSAAPAPTARSLDESGVAESLRGPGAPTKLKLKEESAVVRQRFRQAPAGGLKNAEAEAAAGSVENQLLARKPDSGAVAFPLPKGQAASLLEPPLTNALPLGVNLALAPDTDAKAKQAGFSYTAPAAATAADTFFLHPMPAQAGAATNPVTFFDPLGTGLAAERRATALNGITVPAVPGPTTSAVLAFDTRNKEVKEGRADFGAEKRDGAANLSLADRSAGRERVASTSASGVLLAAEATKPPTLAKQYFRFQRLAEFEKPAAAKPAMESAPTGVLATFVFEQDGDRVRVIDSDGSVYSGRFVTGAEIGQARFAEIGEALNRPVPAGTEPSRQASTAEGARRYSIVAGSSSLTTNRIFRANGTNRTYGQLVTIEASLSGSPEASRGASPAGPTAPPIAGPAAETYLKIPAPPPASAAVVASEIRETRRLVGLVRIGASNEAKLIAVPVAK
jgi:hypothetical protein